MALLHKDLKIIAIRIYSGLSDNIDEVYNKNSIKRKFVNLHERINWLIEEGVDKNVIIFDPIQIRKNLAVDLTLSLKKLQHQKFITVSVSFDKTYECVREFKESFQVTDGFFNSGVCI